MIQYLIDSTIPIRLSCISNLKLAYSYIAMVYLYNEKFYCATQNTARIIKYLEVSPKCGFEVSGDNFPYRGIRGYGNASILKDKGEYILRILLQKYFNKKESAKLSKLLLSEKHLQNEVAIEISPFHIYEWDFKERMSE